MNWIILKNSLVAFIFILLLNRPAQGITTKFQNSAPDSSYCTEIQENTDIPDFNGKSVQTDSIKRTAVIFRNYGYRPFNHLDSMLLFRPDSAINAYREKKQLKLIRLMAEGKIPIGFFNLDYNKLFGYNLFEGVKIGMGGETNGKLSHHFSVGGAISYGLKNRTIQQGEWINFYPRGQSDLRFHLSYQDFNLEFGGSEFLESNSLLNPESYRNLLIANMFATRRYTAGMEFRLFNTLNSYLFGDLSENSTTLDNPFLLAHPFNPVTLSRIGLKLRYSPGIKFELEDGRLNEVTTSKSEIYLTVIQGLTMFRGEYRNTKIEVKGKFELPLSVIGTTTIMAQAGVMSSKSPVFELFNGNGSFAGTFSLAAPYSFGTMQLNEFAATGYAAIHLRHNFSTWLFPEKFKTRPAFIFAQNIGFGKLNPQYTPRFTMNDYHKGFYESGFEVNNLLRLGYLSFGAGIYYRYGPYQCSAMPQNFAYKFGAYLKL